MKVKSEKLQVASFDVFINQIFFVQHLQWLPDDFELFMEHVLSLGGLDFLLDFLSDLLLKLAQLVLLLQQRQSQRQALRDVSFGLMIKDKMSF